MIMVFEKSVVKNFTTEKNLNKDSNSEMCIFFNFVQNYLIKAYTPCTALGRRPHMHPKQPAQRRSPINNKKPR